MRDDDTVSNTSTATPMSRLMQTRLTRRDALKGMAAAGVYGLFGCATGNSTRTAGLTFTESGRFLDATHHVAPGYNVQVLLRWGDPILKGAPAFNPAQQSAAAQLQQFGPNNDFMAFMPLPYGSNSATRGLLCVSHEYVSPQLMWPGYTAEGYNKSITRAQVETEMAAHGHSVVEIEKSGSIWRVAQDSAYNRRINMLDTAMRVGGPAAGHPRLATRADVGAQRIIGTLANCAGGTTPWGTVLIAEENFQNYFAGNPAGREAAAWKRYGVDGRARYFWGRHIDRFNMNREPNETNRFGWIVEIDPYNPNSMPVKRTALGRANHECATTAISHDGRVAVYSGDDKRMEYVYKFVTSGRYDSGNRAANLDLLDNGTPYVARFEADGTMRWLPLLFGQGPLTKVNGFESQADVMIEKRRAADLLGATPMDRPEDVEAHPDTGRVYVVCTFNESRIANNINAANPRAENKWGHIIEIIPPLVDGKPDQTATECRWEFFIMGGDPKNPQHRARYGDGKAAPSDTGWIAAPDNVVFDPKGRIWIATDGQDDWVGFADSVYAAETSGPRRGITKCFFSSPRGAEICGPTFTPDGKTLFLAIQHPGDEKGSTYDKPSTRWPDFNPNLPPRAAVVAVTRADGGEIGS
jgi:secreted PhoX family phosphatase